MSASDGRTVGVDLGATLAKVVLGGDPSSHRWFASGDDAGIRAAIEALEPDRIVATGGGGARLGTDFGGVPVRQVGEFDAWATGVRVLADIEGVELPPEFVLASVGTGTSVLRIGDEPPTRVGGTAVGGGTLMGLGRLLTSCDTFDEIVALATTGDRKKVDLLVGDVYEIGDAPPEIRHLTASNFASLGSQHPADLAHAVIGLVGETVALVTGANARATRLETVVYCGTTFANNQPLIDIVRLITEHFGQRTHVLVRGGFGGAMGAAAIGAAAIG